MPGGDDDHVGMLGSRSVAQRGFEAVQAGHADVVGAHDAATHLARDPRGFVGGRRVGCASGQQGDHAAGLGRLLGVVARDQDGAAVGRGWTVAPAGSSSARSRSTTSVLARLTSTRPARLTLEQRAHGGQRHAGRLARGVDDLGYAFARLAVRVDLDRRRAQHGGQAARRDRAQPLMTVSGMPTGRRPRSGGLTDSRAGRSRRPESRAPAGRLRFARPSPSDFDAPQLVRARSRHARGRRSGAP